MIHEILPVGPLACNCSIFGNEQNGEGMVIDPGDDISEILKIIRRHQLDVRAIVVTHAHIDHIGGAQTLKEATGALVYLNANDLPLYDHLDMQAAWLGVPTPERTEVDTYARDGDRIRVGGTDLVILHTPGHTQGSISLWIPQQNKLIAGDTLFLDSIGRTDLPGGDPRQILRSIHDKYFPLPEETVVVPGHGELTTIGREKERNPFLRGL